MASFPTLKTGAVAQYPSSRIVESRVRVLRFVDGSEQRFRNTRGPLRRWVIRLSEVDEAELAAIEAFFEARQGRAGSFDFTDPWDGTVYPDCSFDEDEMETVLMGEDRASAVITIRNNKAG
jgi:phage-related protein